MPLLDHLTYANASIVGNVMTSVSFIKKYFKPVLSVFYSDMTLGYAIEWNVNIDFKLSYLAHLPNRLLILQY
jgi:hypothetical protein